MNAFYEGLAEILDIAPDAVRPELALADYTWDSLAIVSTIALIDECSGRLVEAAALSRCERVGDIEALIAASA
jgi:acyl carrier protein